MRKILAILLILFLFFACYFIYYKTEKKFDNYLFIGDKFVNNKIFSDFGNTCFTDDDYRVIDLINVLKYNQEKKCQSKNLSLHYLLNNADYLIISVGYNDIMLNKEDYVGTFYSEINQMIMDIDSLLDIINNYSYKKVIFLGYLIDDNDYILYLNYHLKKILGKYKYDFLDLNDIFYRKLVLNNDDYRKLLKILVEKYKNY